jgi:hypothetical protein
MKNAEMSQTLQQLS